MIDFASHTLDFILVFVILTNFAVLGASRIGTCILLVTLQGIALSAIPVLANNGDFSKRALALAFITVVVKGALLPTLLSRAMKLARVRQEIQPLVGYGPSLLFGVAAFLASLWLSNRMPLPWEGESNLALPTALFSIFVGFFLLSARRKALMQILGYLNLENGIYAFATALGYEGPFIVEVGILIDLLVAAFLMGIAVFHISNEFEHIDTDRLASLEDYRS